MTKGVFSPQPLTPGRQTRRRRVHHLIRNRTAKSTARDGACSQSGGGRAAAAVPPVLWTSRVAALSPGQSQDRGGTRWPWGGATSARKAAPSGLQAHPPDVRIPHLQESRVPSVLNVLASVSKGRHVHAFAQDRRTFRAFILAAGGGPPPLQAVLCS